MGPIIKYAIVDGRESLINKIRFMDETMALFLYALHLVLGVSSFCQRLRLTGNSHWNKLVAVTSTIMDSRLELSIDLPPHLPTHCTKFSILQTLHHCQWHLFSTVMTEKAPSVSFLLFSSHHTTMHFFIFLSLSWADNSSLSLTVLQHSSFLSITLFCRKKLQIRTSSCFSVKHGYSNIFIHTHTHTVI